MVVFVHGESYQWGSSSLYDGSVLAALGKVIVVTINYRLGILGECVCHAAAQFAGLLRNDCLLLVYSCKMLLVML